MFISSPKKKKYDVVIIGAGAAGITLAHKFAQQGRIQALLLESGSMEYTHEAASLSSVKAEGHFDATHYSNHSQRVFGGTTSVWSNMCSMLEERGFINKEWPIPFSDIKPYYEEAADIVTLRDGAFEQPKASFTDRDNIQYRPYYKGIKHSTRMGEKYLKELQNSKNIDVLINTTCIKINEKNNGIVDITVRPTNEGGQSYNILGSRFIIACGGIGNPRIMQLSKLGKELPVGKYLMEHPHYIDAGYIEVNVKKLAPVIYTSKTIHAFSLSDQYCLDNKLLNASISFHDGERKDTHLLGRKDESFYSIASLRCEMPALPVNQTYLLESEKDEWGQPKQKVVLHLNYDEQAKKIWDIFAKEMLIGGVGRLSLFSEEKLKIMGGGHLMGTTRMGIDTTTSVVDGNCRVHNISNLYVAGSSIFSASCAANPTYSIVAFSLRLANHILAIDKGNSHEA